MTTSLTNSGNNNIVNHYVHGNITKATTIYTYNVYNNIATVTDGEGNTYKIDYDKEGHATKVVDAYGTVVR